MILIMEYMKLSKLERQTHLRLSEACIERGGHSYNCKGLLAHILDTEIPKGMKIHLCHACHNEKCSNPNHLYWGTPKENREDSDIVHGKKSVWQRTVEKYGYEEACKINGRGNKAAGGRGNKGKPKSELHIQHIKEAFQRKKQGELM